MNLIKRDNFFFQNSLIIKDEGSIIFKTIFNDQVVANKHSSGNRITIDRKIVT